MYDNRGKIISYRSAGVTLAKIEWYLYGGQGVSTSSEGRVPVTHQPLLGWQSTKYVPAVGGNTQHRTEVQSKGSPDQPSIYLFCQMTHY